MPDFYFRANELAAVGFQPSSGDVIIRALQDEREESMDLAFPGDDIPKLMLMLSKAYADNVTGNPDLAIPVDSARFLPASAPGSISLRLELAAGVPVTFAIPEPLAAQLRDQLIARLR